MVKIDSAIILCGGRSTRMGFDKQDIRINNQPIVLHIATQIELLVKEIIIVTNRPELYRKSGYKIVEDVIKECGPMAGVYSGLLNASNEYSYVVAGDMPNVNLDYIRYLDKIMRGMKEVPDVLAIKREGRIEPFHAVYAKSLCSLIYKDLQNGNHRLYKFIESVNSSCIDERDVLDFNLRKMFTNLNTASDYERYN